MRTVLYGEFRGAADDLELLLEFADALARLTKLGALERGPARLFATINAVLSNPVAEPTRARAQIGRDLSNRPASSDQRKQLSNETPRDTASA